MSRILIVDDSPVDLTLIEGLLREGGDFDLDTAKDGEEALQKIRRDQPDLVLTDMRMPVMDGLELVRTIVEEFPLVPVVLATAQGSEELAVEALELGAASYVPKNRLSADLLEIVDRVISASIHRRVEAKLMKGLVLQTCTFELRSDQSMFRPLIHHLQNQLAQIGFGEESERTRIGVALEEAMNNALEHGNLEVDSELRETSIERYIEEVRSRSQQEEYGGRVIRLESRITPEEARFVIRDEGRGFDPSKLADPKAPENLEKAAGRGILLMRTFMDDVVFNERGNQVELRKRAAADHA